MSRDLHNKPFDDGTLAKLDLFRFYVREWLPVFLSPKKIYWKTINIYDFFAGPGKDINGISGTPYIILEELEPYRQIIIEKGFNINLYFNEFDGEKCKLLKKSLQNIDVQLPVSIEIDSLDFVESFNSKYNSLIGNDNANLLFFDQTGIKQINPERFSQVIDIKRTDFLFFISSSTIKRFPDHPAIAKHINLNTKEVENTPYHKIHNLVLDYYKSLIPKNKEYYLAPFSIKKKSGLYGIIFGSNNVLGIEKFLNSAWKIDPERGTANFDIDNDNIIPGQGNLFTGEVERPKKVEVFELALQEKIKNREITSDKEVYLFTLDAGMKIPFARSVIKLMIKNNVISSDKLELSNVVCKPNAQVTIIKLK